MPIECTPAPTTKRPVLKPGFAKATSGSETTRLHARSTATRLVVPSVVAPSEIVKRSPRQNASVTVTTVASEVVNVNGLPIAVDPCDPKKNGCQESTAIGVAPTAMPATAPAITTALASASDFAKTVLRMILLLQLGTPEDKSRRIAPIELVIKERP